MNKLVSRNPIQRFKEGKNIIKAQQGQQMLYLTDDNGVTNEYWRGGSDWYFRPKGGTGMTRVNYSNKRFYSSTPRGAVANDFNTARNYQHTDYSWMTKGTRQRTPEKIQKLQNPESSRAPQQNRVPQQNEEQEIPKAKRRVISGPSFYGTRAGGQVKVRDRGFTGFDNLINNDQKQKLIGAGFQDSDFTNVKAFQKALNRYFAKDNVGSISEDGLWGSQTQKAFDFALGKANSPRVIGGISDPVITLAKQTPVSTPNITIPDQLPQINVQIPQKTFNRSDIRQYIKGKGFDPYQFTGSQRKALRMVMNGTGTDEDLNIAKSMGVFKKGGILKFQNAGNLPTAPKAEDRYKGGHRTITVVHPYDPLEYGFCATRPIRQVNNGSTSISEIIRDTEDGSPADTLYYEVPNHFPFVNVKPRHAYSYGNLSSKYGFNPEYEILKRRFNTAWNLAK